MIEIGLVGCGAVVHSNYAYTLRGRQAYRVALVCDVDAKQAASAAALFGARVASLDEIAERSDAVVISTPPSTHDALVRATLATNRVVLCEKPFMTSAADARALTEHAERVGALLRVGQFRRTYPQLELAQRLVALGVIGDVTKFTASEGGRFTWRSVSDYPIRDPNGGVLWDTGSHTLDMAMFAAGLDQSTRFDVADLVVERDRPEPSHDYSGSFSLNVDWGAVAGEIRVSRRETQPGRVRITGTKGSIAFLTDMDNRIRLTTAHGTTVVCSEREHKDLFECFDLQLRRVLLRDDDEPFAAKRFISQVQLLEALSNA